MINYILIIIFMLVGGVGNKNLNNVYKNQVNIPLNLIDQKLQLDEIRFLQNNTTYYYRRDDYEKSNMNFDNDYILFNKDGSGIYHQTDGKEYRIEWTCSKSNEIEYRIISFREEKDLIVTWEDLVLKDNILTYTEYYTHYNGVNSLATAKRSMCSNENSIVNR